MINYGTTVALTFDISSLATSSTFLGGYESVEVDNTTTRWDDWEVFVEPIVGHATTAPVIGQQIQLFAWGANLTIGTNTIDTLDGTSSAETLSHDSVRQSLKFVAAPTVTVATAALSYYIQPFSIAQLFGGNLPPFFGLFLAHNHAGSLAAAQAAKFSYRGIKYTAT